MSSKINFTIFILFIQSFIGTSAQNPLDKLTYNVGRPYPVVDAPVKLYFTRGGEMISIKWSKKETIVQKFNLKTMAQTSAKSFNPTPAGAAPEAFYQIKDKFYFFYSTYSESENITELKAKEIDFKSGTISETEKSVLSVPGGANCSVSMYNAVTRFSFSVSVDSTKVLIRYEKGDNQINKPGIMVKAFNMTSLGLCVMTPELTQIWKKEVEMPTSDKKQKVEVLSFTLSNGGDVFLLSRVFEDESGKVKKGKDASANYHLEVWMAGAEAGTFVRNSLNIADNHISNARLFGGKDGIVGGGFYCKVKNLDNKRGIGEQNADGVYTFKADGSGKLQNMVYHEIPLEILNMYSSGSEQRKNNKENENAEFQNMGLDRLHVSADGSITLIGEQVNSVSTYQSQGGYTSTNYFCKDILVAKINADGSLAWMKRLPKRQEGSKFELMSYFYDFNSASSSHIFLFLDSEKNKTLPIDKVPSTLNATGGGFLTAYGVNEESGDISKKYLFDVRNIKGTVAAQFSTERIGATDNDEYVIEVYKKDKEDVLIKLSLKN